MVDIMHKVSKIQITDRLDGIKDKLTLSDKRPKGRVQVFEKRDDGKLEKIEDTSNLIVYQGREWLLQRALNVNSPGWDTDAPDWIISWFGLGTGGAGANLLIPLVPDVTDTDLTQPAIINATDPTLANSGKLHPFDSIDVLEDTSNDNRRLIASISTTISQADANGPDGTTYYDLNEAGLYVSNSIVPGSVLTDSITMFARVTFSTIRKNSSRSLVFLWYIYF